MPTYSDIDFSFGLDSKGDIKLATDADAILQSIKMILFTRVGLRPGYGNRRFGTDTLSYLFSPVTEGTAQYLGETILEALEFYEPRINIVNINVRVVEDTSYDINIEYEILIPDLSGTRNFRLSVNAL